MRYQMTGAQPIRLSTGVTVAPGAPDFDAALEPGEDDFLTRIGALRRVAIATAPVAPAQTPTKASDQ